MTTKVVLSPNVKKTSVRLDREGNNINPSTKQIITPLETEFVPPTVIPNQTETPTSTALTDPPFVPKVDMSLTPVQIDPMSIQTQIEQVKQNLKKLEELKKLKIKELKKQVELLEKE
jgi:hypothetical protein